MRRAVSMCVRAARALAAVLVGDDLGGMLARRLLPAAILIPAVLGWLRLEGERAGLYGTEFGTVMMVAATIVLLSATIIWSALLLRRTDLGRERAQEELKENEERFRLLVEGIKDYAIFMLDPQGRIVSWNEGARRIKGYDRREILGRHFSIFYPEEDRKRGKPERCLEMAREKGTYEEEGWRVRKDGSRFWASVLITALRGEDGDLRGFSKVTRDVTERKQSEEEIRELNEALEKRVAERTSQLARRERELKELVGKLIGAQEEERRRIAYEMHDGLTQAAVAAHQHLQAFADDHPPGSTVSPRELDRVLAMAQRTVKEARHVIGGLRPAALDDFGLAAAIRQQVEERKKDEGLKLSYQDKLGEERLPPEIETSLYRVVQEALTNISKHAQTNKEAHLTVARLGPKVRLEIRDEGRGFDPSSKAAASEEDGGPGERVGLIGMRERIELLEGELKIESKPGSGTSVIAEVPLPEKRGVGVEHEG